MMCVVLSKSANLKMAAPKSRFYLRMPSKLKFLSKNKTYVAEIYRDADNANWKTNPIDYKIEKRLVTRDSIFSFHLAPGGGEAIRLKPATPEEQKALKPKS